MENLICEREANRIEPLKMIRKKKDHIYKKVKKLKRVHIGGSLQFFSTTIKYQSQILAPLICIPWEPIDASKSQ